jgi:hypothetical protein
VKKHKFNKGIYCLEGLWEEHNLADKASVLPVLELLKRVENCDYIYHDCATRGELDFYLKKFVLKKYITKYPILYFAFHGNKNCILLRQNEKVQIDEIAELLEGQCGKSIIFFASCLTLKIDSRLVRRFLKRTGAVAAVGYKSDVDWVKSTAFEMLLLQAFQNNAISVGGMRAIKNRISKEYRQLARDLEFRMIINE